MYICIMQSPLFILIHLILLCLYNSHKLHLCVYMYDILVYINYTYVYFFFL